jgi:hypothetical protein
MNTMSKLTNQQADVAFEYLLIANRNCRPYPNRPTRTTINLLAFGVGFLLPMALGFYGSSFYVAPKKAHTEHMQVVAAMPSQMAQPQLVKNN